MILFSAAFLAVGQKGLTFPTMIHKKAMATKQLSAGMYLIKIDENSKFETLNFMKQQKNVILNAYAYHSPP